MSRWHILPLLLIASGIAAAGCAGSDTTAPVNVDAEVFTPGNTFSPFSTTVPVGGIVRFNLSGDSHNVIFDAVAGAPTNINIVTNQAITRTFTVAGTFPYQCTVHPGMTGQVVVHP